MLSKWILNWYYDSCSSLKHSTEIQESCCNPCTWRENYGGSETVR